jgi:hypothetical protein
MTLSLVFGRRAAVAWAELLGGRDTTALNNRQEEVTMRVRCGRRKSFFHDRR